MYCIGILIFPQQIFRLMKALKKEFIICCNHKSMHNTCKYLFVEALELIKVFAASFNCLQREKEYFSQIFICNFKSLYKLFYSQIHKGFTFSLKIPPSWFYFSKNKFNVYQIQRITTTNLYKRNGKDSNFLSLFSFNPVAVYSFYHS